MPGQTSAYTTATETARRLGVSVRALRVYERHGLVGPRRTAAGWRLYGPDQVEQLHNVLALKRFGLKLAQIAALMRGGTVPLERLLALQKRSSSGASSVRIARSRSSATPACGSPTASH